MPGPLGSRRHRLSPYGSAAPGTARLPALQCLKPFGQTPGALPPGASVLTASGRADRYTVALAPGGGNSCSPSNGRLHNSLSSAVKNTSVQGGWQCGQQRSPRSADGKRDALKFHDLCLLPLTALSHVVAQ